MKTLNEMDTYIHMMAYGLNCVRRSKNPFLPGKVAGVSTQWLAQSSKLSFRQSL